MIKYLLTLGTIIVSAVGRLPLPVRNTSYWAGRVEGALLECLRQNG